MCEIFALIIVAVGLFLMGLEAGEEVKKRRSRMKNKRAPFFKAPGCVGLMGTSVVDDAFIEARHRKALEAAATDRSPITPPCSDTA